MKVKYIAAILLSTQLVYTACDDMGFLQIKPDSLELTDDRIKTVAESAGTFPWKVMTASGGVSVT